MNECAPDKAFWLHDGKALRNIRELAEALKTMSPETFKHHVTATKNDFAAWLDHVMSNKKLAQQISRTNSQKDMQRLLSEERMTHKKAKKTAMKPKKKIGKRPKKHPVFDETFKSIVEPANHHIALAAHVALGIVVGSALTLLVLMIL